LKRARKSKNAFFIQKIKKNLNNKPLARITRHVKALIITFLSPRGLKKIIDDFISNKL